MGETNEDGTRHCDIQPILDHSAWLYLEQLAGVLEYFEELRVSEGGGDLAVFGETAVGVGFGDGVHLAHQLRQKLDADDRMLGRSFL